ncbi:Lar family restriction alleviation protein [Thiolapillus sp.]
MIEPTSEAALKPCPFCGESNARVLVEAVPGRIHIFVHCSSCGARGETIGANLKDRYYPEAIDIVTEMVAMSGAAAESWNMRRGGQEQ